MGIPHGSSEGEFVVKKVMSWEGDCFEVTVSLQLISNQTCSLPNPNLKVITKELKTINVNIPLVKPKKQKGAQFEGAKLKSGFEPLEQSHASYEVSALPTTLSDNQMVIFHLLLRE